MKIKEPNLTKTLNHNSAYAINISIHTLDDETTLTPTCTFIDLLHAMLQTVLHNIKL